MACRFGVWAGILLTAFILAAPGWAGPEEFRVAHVRVRVLDPANDPMPNATVKAFSQDWSVPSPIDGAARTDDKGEAILTMVVGRWSFYSGAEPPWTNQYAGDGQFLAVPNVEVKGDMTLVMRPTKEILLHVADADNVPRNTMFWAMASDAVPLVIPLACGWTPDGTILLHVTDAGAVDVLCHADASPTQMGLHMLARKLLPGSETTVCPTAANSCRVRASFRDENQSPLRSDVWVNYRDFAVGESTGLDGCRAMPVFGTAEFYVSPGVVEVMPKIIQDGWGLPFRIEEYTLVAGKTYNWTYGGRLKIATRTLRPYGQIWTDVTDAYGHALTCAWNAKGHASLVVTLYAEGREVAKVDVADVVGENNVLGARLDKTETPAFLAKGPLQFQYELDLGPLGRHMCAGTLFAPDNLMRYETVSTSHFRFRIPEGQRPKFEPLMRSLEDIYEGEVQASGQSLDKPCVVTFNINNGIAGTAGYLCISMGIGFSLDSPHLIANSTYRNVVGHELGHVFNGSIPDMGLPPGSSLGEPFATYLGYEGQQPKLGERMMDYTRGRHARFFRRLYGEIREKPTDHIEEVQFILFYLRKHYGIQIHRDFLATWQRNKKGTLASLPPDTATAAIYSHLAKQNLAWLFRLGGYTMTDAEVAGAMAHVK